jgi:hypothetical protein
MGQIIGLIVFYSFTILSFILIIGVVSCMTNQSPEKPSTTEPKPTGQTPETLTTTTHEWERQYRAKHGLHSPYKIE